MLFIQCIYIYIYIYINTILQGIKVIKHVPQIYRY